MKKQLKTEYVLTKREGHIVRHCLEYCQHRFIKHDKCGLRGVVKISKIKQIIKELK